jgi:hypothetical protein
MSHLKVTTYSRTTQPNRDTKLHSNYAPVNKTLHDQNI